METAERRFGVEIAAAAFAWTSPSGLGYRADVEGLRDPEQRSGVVEAEEHGHGLELGVAEAGPAGQLVVGRPV